jgi:hypothetical protein
MPVSRSMATGEDEPSATHCEIRCWYWGLAWMLEEGSARAGTGDGAWTCAQRQRGCAGQTADTRTYSCSSEAPRRRRPFIHVSEFWALVRPECTRVPHMREVHVDVFALGRQVFDPGPVIYGRGA